MKITGWLLLICSVALIAAIVGLFIQQEIDKSRLWAAFHLTIVQMNRSIRTALTGKLPPKDDGGEQ